MLGQYNGCLERTGPIVLTHAAAALLVMQAYLTLQLLQRIRGTEGARIINMWVSKSVIDTVPLHTSKCVWVCISGLFVAAAAMFKR